MIGQFHCCDKFATTGDFTGRFTLILANNLVTIEMLAHDGTATQYFLHP